MQHEKNIIRNSAHDFSWGRKVVNRTAKVFSVRRTTKLRFCLFARGGLENEIPGNVIVREIDVSDKQANLLLSGGAKNAAKYYLKKGQLFKSVFYLFTSPCFLSQVSMINFALSFKIGKQ